MNQQGFKPLSKNQFTVFRKLSTKKGRTEQGCFVVEGLKVVGEFLEAGWELNSLLATSSEIQQICRFPGTTTDRVFMVSEKDMERLSNFTTPPGILAVFRMHGPESMKVKGNLLILDGISDPGNMGGMLRCAEWFGISGIYCTSDCVELFNPKVVQASMGSLARLHIAVAEADSIVQQVKKDGHLLAGAVLNGSDVHSFQTEKSWALIIGNESHGIREPFLSALELGLTIPRLSANRDRPESLNALSACSVLLDRMSSVS